MKKCSLEGTRKAICLKTFLVIYHKLLKYLTSLLNLSKLNIVNSVNGFGMKNTKNFLLYALFFLLMASFALNLVLLNKPTDLSAILPRAEDQSIIDYLSKIIDLPVNESPTIAEVKDAQNLKLQDELLYKDVLNGDRLVIYSGSIVIFRPLTGKILQVVKINN